MKLAMVRSTQAAPCQDADVFNYEDPEGFIGPLDFLLYFFAIC